MSNKLYLSELNLLSLGIWPNQEGKVMLDSKLLYNKKLEYWSFIWVYGKEVCENQADYIHVMAIDPRVRLALDNLISYTARTPAKKCNSMKHA
ncbi:4031_t:CDS:2 [Cetraspora pellucida]|uniref:4031_t:CDS:1 n=1 Tax=Cetraspora pellucida TaxID=1433469 RepID=A0A9N9IQ71_9GLOM|nr:4031_t:CDS:2 [Cetraspora pellucida]